MADAPPPEIQRMLRLFVEQSREHCVLFLDPAGKLLWLSPGAEHVTGFRTADVAGRGFAELFTPGDQKNGIPGHELEVATKNGAAENDRWMGRADGSRFYAAGLLVAVRDETGGVLGYAKLFRDRTDTREQLETLKNQVDALTEAGRRREVFLSTLSHELRNPIAPVSNAVHILRRLAPTHPQIEYPVGVIERQLDSIRRLVDDLLDVTRIGSGKLHLTTAPVDLRDVIGRAVETVRPLLDRRKHTLEVLLQPAPIRVLAERPRLQQVFVNLITNAAKYTPDGGKVWVKAHAEADEAVARVEDTGQGIPHDLMPRIFDLFTQADEKSVQGEGGLGIGLALVKELVTLHAGRVQVRSDGKGKGSEFTVRLPLHFE